MIEHHGRHISNREKIQLQQSPLHARRIGADVDFNVLDPHLLTTLPFQLSQKKSHHIVGQRDEFEHPHSVLDWVHRIADCPDDVAAGAGKKVQVSVQSAFGCGFEGPVPPERVLKIVEQFLNADFRNLSLADTAGHATPRQVEQLFGAVFGLAPDAECTCHFHNTYGLGMANCCAAMGVGVKCFESSVAGLGGCPFTKVAGGNVCTEDLVHYLHRLGQRADVDQDTLVELARDLSRFFGRELPGMVYKIGMPPAPASC